jgi:membrane-associated phospholipid phosphatase
MDITVLTYVLFMGWLTVPFHHHMAHWPTYPLVHTVIAFFILELIRFTSRFKSGIFRFVRTFYPTFGLSFAWSELNVLVRMIIPSFWANDFLLNLDLALFGVHPTVWVQNIFTPWLTELMNFFYAVYYLFIPLGAVTLYLRGRKKETLDFLFLVCFTYSIGFFLFLFFPALGPWMLINDLHTVQPEGGIFLHLNQFIQSKGSIRGGCFPSSHVAAATVMALASLRYQKVIGMILLPLAFCVAVATVYCRYHHAVDAISGILLGTILYFVGKAILDARDRKSSQHSKI